jgi:hypothetical protein
MLLRGVTYTQWLVGLPLQAAASPHAAGQWHRRQKATTQRVAIRPDLALQGLRQKVQPVPQGRHFAACGLACVITVEQSALATQWGGHNLVGQRFAAAFPAAQVRNLVGVQDDRSIHLGDLRRIGRKALSVSGEVGVCVA